MISCLFLFLCTIPNGLGGSPNYSTLSKNLVNAVSSWTLFLSEFLYFSKNFSTAFTSYSLFSSYPTLIFNLLIVFGGYDISEACYFCIIGGLLLVNEEKTVSFSKIEFFLSLLKLFRILSKSSIFLLLFCLNSLNGSYN